MRDKLCQFCSYPLDDTHASRQILVGEQLEELRVMCTVKPKGACTRVKVSCLIKDPPRTV